MKKDGNWAENRRKIFPSFLVSPFKNVVLLLYL